MDSELEWKISFNNSLINSCYVCQNHRYTLVFIDKRDKNTGLVEIRD